MPSRVAAVRATALVVAALVVAALLGGCAAAGSSPDVVTVRGAIFMDLHTESTCAEETAPPELTGVVLTFSGADGEAVGMARTGAPEEQDLPPGPGKRGWRAFGCRFLAPYVVELPPMDGYEVTFTPTPEDATSSFYGVEELETQVISLGELEANAFWWAFEVAPTYIVP